MEKKTKMEYFTELQTIVNEAELDADYKEELIDFLLKQIELLEKRKNAAANSRQKKAATPDLMTDAIIEFLETQDDFVTIETIIENIADKVEEVTPNKISARLTKLIKEGLVEKTSIKTEDKAKKMGYKTVD